jgi:carbon-monoxide dehydrogenase large subunit
MCRWQRGDPPRDAGFAKAAHVARLSIRRRARSCTTWRRAAWSADAAVNPHHLPRRADPHWLMCERVLDIAKDKLRL